MIAEVALTSQQIPESLQALKRAARARAEAAKEKEAAEAEAAARLLLDAVVADLHPELAAYLAPVDGGDAAKAAADGKEYAVEFWLPGHRPLATCYVFLPALRLWHRAEFPGRRPLSLWRVWSQGSADYYQDLGAALAAAETDDPSEWAVKPAPGPMEIPF